MPLNKLDNFIKNTEGRILYVNPNDLDSTDSIENQGNALARPFKTVQRAILEAARFSYVRGNNNDYVEKTTILLFPGEHYIDNRPGFAIYNNGGAAYAISRQGGVGVLASTVLSLDVDSIFDLNQEDNILYKFNSFYGGVVIPRGTSIVGIDIRKTKIRPKYVPNPTDFSVKRSSIFRLTGGAFVNQITFFDGDSNGLVYTSPDNFGDTFLSKPNFSHHKLNCFEFCDGVNQIEDYGLTDLDMYYSKVSNAYNAYRNIDQKFPNTTLGFTKKLSEWEIVGDLASDPIEISSIVSGNGLTASAVVTVTTTFPHNLNEGTEIKIRGVSGAGLTYPYNISTRVQNVISANQFTYILPSLSSYITLNPSPSASSATVVVESDNVAGSSPYVFNCSLRSMWGMGGLLADGRRASGFKSTVVAQFTAVSLQKDDRAFVKYNPSTKTYEGLSYSSVYGSDLELGAASIETNKVYHLDPDAVYRSGWESSHIKATNDAFVQISSVFGIGFTKQFEVESGGDFSVTNSNSNFGQIALTASGFKKEAFEKDDRAYITSIISPRGIPNNQGLLDKIEWLPLDVGLTTAIGISSHLYLYGFTSLDDAPSSQTQGYRIGAGQTDTLNFVGSGITYSATIYMCDNEVSSGSTIAIGKTVSVKSYNVIGEPSSNLFTIGPNKLVTGEKIKIISNSGNLPENIDEHRTYYAIDNGDNNKIKVASTYADAVTSTAIDVYKGSNLVILSRVSDKDSGELGSPIQYDTVYGNWFIHVNENNDIYNAFNTYGVGEYDVVSEITYVERIPDKRSLDEKIYKFRVVLPKEAKNARDPQAGFVIQESSFTGPTSNSDFTKTTITSSDVNFQRNPRFISTCSVASSKITVLSELPHNLQIGDIVVVKNVTSTTNTTGKDNLGYNGTFAVTDVIDTFTFKYSTVDVYGLAHTPGTCTNNVNTRSTSLPRFERNDFGRNLFVYRVDIITPYIYNKQDGVYHLHVLNASNAITHEFTDLEFPQAVTDIYPQLDRDIPNDNPRAATSSAKNFPIGKVITNDLKNSITRETVDYTLKDVGIGLPIFSVDSSTNSATLTFSRFHGFSGIVTGSITPGSAYNDGTYYNVKLLSGSQAGIWSGSTAKVVVSSGAVTSVDIISSGSGYGSEALYFDLTKVGAGNGGARYTITTAGISTNIGDVIQVTGLGTQASGYYRITSIPSPTQISIARTDGDPQIFSNQYVFPVGRSVKINSSSYNSTTKITTFVTSSAHGLLAGNKFKVIDSSNNNLGDYFVKSRTNTTTFTAITDKSLSASNGYILKHGLDANDAVSDFTKENLGIRGIPFYEGETFRLTSSVTTGTTINIASDSGIGTAQRLPLGSYVQIDNEIMRIASSANNSSATVIRNVLGTKQENHDSGSMVRRINVIPVEFRRPSIIRASGHTFEYLGYGPGNYSTSLPQVQVKELDDKQTFLAQSQERSGGVVAYTGMNSKGEFFTGNAKTSSMSGKEVSYDLPSPTVTGEDSTQQKLILPVDEVTVRERIIVEGGPNKTVVSVFDGPTSFNGKVRINSELTLTKQLRLTQGTQSTSTKTGDLVVYGGVGIEKNLYVGGKVVILSTDQSTSKDTGALVIEGGVGIEKDLYVGGIAYVDGLNINTTGIGEGDLGSNGGNDSIFGIYNTSNSGTITLNAKDGSGTNNDIVTLTYNSATFDGDVTVNSPYAFYGKGVIPVGGIILWSGLIANIPTGWALCNGSSGTPDLRDKFVVGASTDSGGQSKTTITPLATKIGGTTNSLVVAHTHTGTATASGAHAHKFLISKDRNARSWEGPNGGFVLDTDNYATGEGTPMGEPGASNGAQIGRAVGGDVVDSTGRHTHTVTVNAAGVSGLYANIPPYYALAYIMRIS